MRERFSWLGMQKQVIEFITKCLACLKAKSTSKTNGLYQALLVPIGPWIDRSMDCVLGFPRTARAKDLRGGGQFL